MKRACRNEQGVAIQQLYSSAVMHALACYSLMPKGQTHRCLIGSDSPPNSCPNIAWAVARALAWWADLLRPVPRRQDYQTSTCCSCSQ